MERKTKVKLLLGALIIFLGIILSSKASYASVEIVMGKPVLTNVTVSQSYTYCQEMKNTGQALGRTSVVPHLATNLDWGAVSYLSNSIYGTNMAGGNTGTQITVNNVKYYSTNGNVTGVLDWGKTYTQTSALISGYSNPSTNVTALYDNKDTRFVESIGDKTGMAMHGWYSSWDYIGNASSYPISLRQGLFGFDLCSGRGGPSGHDGGYTASGEANNKVTFRPVVWNQ